jgi:hypothetical protein
MMSVAYHYLISRVLHSLSSEKVVSDRLAKLPVSIYSSVFCVPTSRSCSLQRLRAAVEEVSYYFIAHKLPTWFQISQLVKSKVLRRIRH